jgi:hypothetical protein
MRSIRSRLTLLLSTVLLAACAAPVSLALIDVRSEYRLLTRNAMSDDALSEGTRNTLRRLALHELHESQLAVSIEALRTRVVGGVDDPGELFALAEVSYLLGRGGGSPHLPAAVIYAYAHLFSTSKVGDGTMAFEPRFGQVLDLYNLSLSGALSSPAAST